MKRTEAEDFRGEATMRMIVRLFQFLNFALAGFVVGSRFLHR